MELPDWVVDEIIRPATPVAVRLVIILYRHGRQVVDSSGSRRVYWRGSTAELARLTGVSKRHLIAAEHYLADASFLTLHNQTRPNAPHAISARYDRPETQGGYKLSPLAESENPHHGDDASNTDPFDQITEEPDTTTTTQAAVTICNRLTDWGVTSPLRWLAQFGTERVTAALAAFEAEHASDARNPAGFLYTLLTSPETTSTLFARSRATTPAPEDDAYEAQKRRFLSGPLAHVIKTGAAIE